MQLIQEAGITGIAIVGLFITALGCLLTGRSTSATPWAIALLAVGEIGQSLGMRAVSEAITGDKGVDDLLLLLAVGSTEASANLLLGGAAALVVVALAAVQKRANA